MKKSFTPRDLLRGGFKDMLTASASGEDVYIEIGRSQWDASRPSAPSINKYGEQVAHKRFKIVAEDI